MTPKLYRKKPVEVEAVQVTKENIVSVAVWCKGFQVVANAFDSPPVAIMLPTIEGTMRAGIGDYIIRGVEREFYPCKPGIFHQTYEEVAE